MDAIPLLEVRDLTVEFATRRGTVRAVERDGKRAIEDSHCGVRGLARRKNGPVRTARKKITSVIRRAVAARSPIRMRG